MVEMRLDVDMSEAIELNAQAHARLQATVSKAAVAALRDTQTDITKDLEAALSRQAPYRRGELRKSIELDKPKRVTEKDGAVIHFTFIDMNRYGWPLQARGPHRGWMNSVDGAQYLTAATKHKLIEAFAGHWQRLNPHADIGI